MQTLTLRPFSNDPSCNQWTSLWCLVFQPARIGIGLDLCADQCVSRFKLLWASCLDGQRLQLLGECLVPGWAVSLVKRNLEPCESMSCTTKIAVPIWFQSSLLAALACLLWSCWHLSFRPAQNVIRHTGVRKQLWSAGKSLQVWESLGQDLRSSTSGFSTPQIFFGNPGMELSDFNFAHIRSCSFACEEAVARYVRWTCRSQRGEQGFWTGGKICTYIYIIDYMICANAYVLFDPYPYLHPDLHM